MSMSVTDVFGNLFGGMVASAPAVKAALLHPKVTTRSGKDGKVYDTTNIEKAAAEKAEADLDYSCPECGCIECDGDVADFDNLPAPGPACAVCGSLESWTDLLGRERCGVCERATLDRAIQWADRATRLRKQAQPRKPAPQNRALCVPGSMAESKHVGDNLA